MPMVNGRTMTVAALLWAVHLSLYLAFAADLGWREWVAGTIVAAMATTAAIGFARVAGIRFAFQARDLSQGFRLAAAVVTGTAVVFRALLARPGDGGLVSRVPFRFGTNDEPAEVGRRALAIVFTSASANSIVLGVTADPPTVRVHQLVPGPTPAVLRRLGAEA